MSITEQSIEELIREEVEDGNFLFLSIGMVGDFEDGKWQVNYRLCGSEFRMLADEDDPVEAIKRALYGPEGIRERSRQPRHRGRKAKPKAKPKSDDDDLIG